MHAPVRLVSSVCGIDEHPIERHGVARPLRPVEAVEHTVDGLLIHLERDPVKVVVERKVVAERYLRIDVSVPRLIETARRDYPLTRLATRGAGS